MSEAKLKPFSEHGHYTAVHDAVFDVVMPFCPPNAFKVLLFVLRKTRGWKKDEDVLRYAEIKAGTGIKSDATLAKELDWLLRKKLLDARDESGGPHRKGSRKAPAYSLNRDFELKATPEATTSENEVSTTSENEASNNHPSQETSYEANASRPMASPKASPEAKTSDGIGLEKYITDRLYDAYKQAGYPKWTKDEYGFHLGRAKKILEENEPTDEEIECLPSEFVAYYTDWNPKADAVSTLREMRRRVAREQNTDRRKSEHEPSFYEQQGPAQDKPKGAIWYASLYESADFETVRRWIEEGLSHSEIERRLEGVA